MNRQKEAALKIIKAARIIDGLGGEPLANQAIVVQDGRIREIKPWAEASISAIALGAAVIDLENATLLPGFIDAHVHLALDPRVHGEPDRNMSDESRLLLAVGNAQAALQAGVTTVGDAGGPNHLVFALRDAIKDGLVTGPRILASGYPITTVKGHGMPGEYAEETGVSDATSPQPSKAPLGRVAHTTEEVQEAVRLQAEAGADLIKIMATSGGGKPDSQYGLAELQAAVAEARRLGKRIIAHCHGTTGIRDAVEAGVTRVEHCSFMEQGDSIFRADIAEAMVRKGIYVCPTNDIDYRNWERLSDSEDREKLAPRSKLIPTWRELYRHGVPFVAGSDAGASHVFFDDYALTLELMVSELGLSPMQAILTGTRVAAEAMGLEAEIGTLEIGKRADLVAVSGDPLQDIASLRRTRLVMSGGQVIHR